MISFRRKTKSKVIPGMLLVGLVGGALAITGFNESKNETLPTQTLTLNPSPTQTPIVLNHAKEIQEIKKEIEALKVSRGTTRQESVVNAINKHLRGRLSGKGNVIYKLSREQEPAVNPILVTSVILHELGEDCSSQLFERTDNVAGINWTPDSPYEKSGRYNDYKKKGGIDESIKHLCRILSRYYIAQGQNTIELIGIKYAPLSDKDNGKHGMSNEAWIPNVTKIYQKIAQGAAL